MVERRHGMLPPVVCDTYKTNWQTENHRMKEDFELHVVVQLSHFGLEILFIQTPRKTEVISITLSQRCFQECHLGLARHRELRRARGSSQKIQVQRSRHQQLAGCICILLCRRFLETKRSRTTLNFTPQ